MQHFQQCLPVGREQQVGNSPSNTLENILLSTIQISDKQNIANSAEDVFRKQPLNICKYIHTQNCYGS